MGNALLAKFSKNVTCYGKADEFVSDRAVTDVMIAPGTTKLHDNCFQGARASPGLNGGHGRH